MRFCKCGAIYQTRCEKCYQPPPQQARDKTTTERGYGGDHKEASVRYRADHPLCEACCMRSVVMARPSQSLHHIRKISHAPHLRMKPENWLALCDPCHHRLEDDEIDALKVKLWSMQAYEDALRRPEEICD